MRNTAPLRAIPKISTREGAMKHTDLEQRRMERGLTLDEMAAATCLPAWVLRVAESELRGDARTVRVRARMGAALLRIRVVPTL